MALALDPRVVEFVTRNQIWLLIKDYPRPLFLGLFPRVLIYQFLWMLFAIRHGGLGAYSAAWGRRYAAWA